MPVQSNFLEEGIGVEFITSGVLTGEEIIAANQELYTRENLLRLRYKVIDRTSCTRLPGNKQGHQSDSDSGPGGWKELAGT